ncbi:MAG: PAS domain-containing protein, partial [Kangiellaceae bacterium]|nr:PAS domain-containing protein [Kangiellaceae bacterium]
MKLLPKVIAVCSLVAFIVIGGLGYFVYSSVKSDRLFSIRQSIDSDVSFVVAKLEEKQTQISAISRAISRNRQITKALSLFENRGVSQELNESILIYPYINYILISEIDGTVFTSSTRDGKEKKLQGEELLLRNIKEHPLFTPPLEREVIKSAIAIDPYLKLIGLQEKLAQLYTVNIYKRGNIIGQLSVSVDWQRIYSKELKDVIDQLSTYKQSIIGALIYDNDGEIILSELYEGNKQNLNFVNAEHYTPSISKLTSTKDHWVGDEKLQVILSFDQQTELQAIKTIAANIAGITVASIVLMSVLLYIILKQVLLTRISELHKSTRQIGKGDFSFRIRDLGSDEIGDLADNLNSMVRQLGKNTTSIEELNKVSELRRIALRELDEQKIALNKHAIVDITDLEGNITFANEKLSEISGYSNGEIVGKNHRIFNSGYHDVALFTDLYQTIMNGNVWKGEICNRSKSKEHFWVDTTIVPFFEDDNKPSSYIAIRTDITERKNAEFALKENTRQLELVIDSTGVGVWDWQVQTGAVTYNERWAEIIGYTLAELTPLDITTWEKHAHPDDLKKSAKFLEAHWSGNTNRYECEARMIHKNGNTIWVLDSGKVVEWNEDGSPGRMIGTHQDITRSKNDEVNLIESKVQAENAARAKSEFLASMSHEIRTPMNGVLGMLGLVLHSELSNEQKHKIEVAQSSAKSLLSLINDILDFSKVEAGKVELEYLDFDLRNMLGEISESMGLQAQTKNLELILDIKKVNESYVKGDPGRIRQIITNIVGNAIKFTSYGEIVIKAELTVHDRASWRLQCSISDTGIGIERDNVSRLFDSFVQVDASTTRKYGGTGLGLAIVKKLCVLMGGDIKVSTQLGKGSQFIFDLILLKSKHSKHVIPQVAMHELNLLVVDDNKTNREVLTTQLEHWGAKVTEAVSGPEALEICDEVIKQGSALFDIAFLDMQMSEMDGAELGKILKANPSYKKMHLVMMTSIGTQGDAKLFSELGFDAYFPKPATTSDLFAALSIVAEDGETLKDAEPLVTSHYVRDLAQISPIDTTDNSALRDVRILIVEDNPINLQVAIGILNEYKINLIDSASNGREAIEVLTRANPANP